jgi:putative mRNA 3-end processing factor
VTRRVRLGRGVEFRLSTGETVVADGAGAGIDADCTVLSHAHADHSVPKSAGPVVCSPCTADLVAARSGSTPERLESGHPLVDLVDAGHVAGSKAALIHDAAADRDYLYTADCSVRDRFFLDGFEPPSADVLVIETTYGKPEYTFPEQSEIEAEIVDWLADTRDRPVLLFGYSLGRAQQLELLAQRAERERVFVWPTVAAVDAAIEPHYDVTFEGVEYDADAVDLGPGDALVLPTNFARSDTVSRLVDERDALKAGFSGWAVDDSYLYRGGHDVTFPLTDHCDFSELAQVVEAVDPEVVYTQHGFTEAFATHVTTELGYEAWALKRDQTALSEFY